MFEVIRQGNGWAWQMICDKGRVLYGPSETFADDLDAANAAKAWRVSFWRIADQVDWRMGRAI